MSARDRFAIDEDIRKASTLPGWVYTDAEAYERIRDRVFARSWQLAGDTDRVKVPGQVSPFTLLESFLEEPLLLTRDKSDTLHCLSNVCTHRANLVAENEGVEPFLRCRYHGRRFALDGKFLSMPEFEQTASFPSPADDLKPVMLGVWAKFLFVSLDPMCPFDAWIGDLRARVRWLPMAESLHDAARSREYLVRANWALYCDNYLEGFHIPFVHAGLASALDYGSYRTELFPWGSLQVGIANEGEDCFALPPGSPDKSQRVAAYYFWLYPNTMFNFYPWGLSINVVRPLALDRTKVSFLSYVIDPSRLEVGAGATLDRVEREDERIVEAAQRGAGSRFYDRGRYSPTREQGVHHFHRLLARSLDGD
ncbi:MAG TPA: aromatic ring-hydroxylating dioxygenase subunit alpha [Candidatus Eisenbacteria bacterium]|nr:aromatic ring-hydroxylating dioxygenase subunit alpha [Candidatus Eisenbacteria bacterium]